MTRTLAQTMMETSPGTLLAGKYRVERVLGTGGMGVVVAALHEQLDERVAIKLLRADRIAQSEAIERALREARATVKIQSDHVVRVFDVGTLDSGAPYIVMEYLAGCDLAQLLCAEGKLDIADAASYVRQACDAVVKAHAIGIVHRDLKPANLFLAVRDDVSTIKVLDFGISKFVQTDGGRVDASLTRTASVLGSPAYMSPEQLESPRDIDGRTDVWSLGVILFELLTGAHPFVADTLPQLYKRIAEAPAPSVRSVRPEVPADLDAIVARCLAKRPQDRFGDAQSLASALAPFADEAKDHPVSQVALAETAMANSAEIESARIASKISGQVAPVLALGISRTQPRRRRFVYGGVALAGLAVAATSTLVCTRADQPRTAAAAAIAPPALLAKPGSILACPPLVAKGIDQPAGWFGAAASTIACTRAMARMGGRPARTQVPAELLDLPAMPVDNYPEDAFAGPTTRATAIAAAKLRAQAWLDGEIERTDTGYALTLVLREGDREVARGSSKAATLVEAIRTAMQPIEGAIPPAPADDPFLREWFGARTAEAATTMVDWSMQVRLEWPGKAECDRVLASPDVMPLAKRAVRTWCTEDPVDSPDRDESSPGALIMSIEADGRQDKRPAQDDLARLDAAIAKTEDKDERAILLGIKAGAASSRRDYNTAMQTSLAALSESPKAFTPWTGAWNILTWVRASTNAAPAAVAWTPWNVEAYCFSAMRQHQAGLGAKYMHRNTILSRHKIWAESEIDFLVEDHRSDDARSAAARLPGDPVHAMVEAGEGHFTVGLELARATMKRDDSFDAWWSAWMAGQISMVLGQPAPDMDALLKKWFETEPLKVVNNPIVENYAMVSCLAAPHDIAKRCLARVRHLTGGAVFFSRDIFDGGDRFVEGDYAGAARAWRDLVAHPDWRMTFLHDFVAIAFERSGQLDIATRIDAPYVKDAGRFNGVEPAHVREALRAEKRGDVETARRLAKRVFDAWSVADGLDGKPVPAVAEMQKLLARLDGHVARKPTR